MPAIVTVLVCLGQNMALLFAALWLYRLVYPHERAASSRLSPFVLGGLVGGLGLLGITVPIAVAPGVVLDGRALLVGLVSAWAGPFAAIPAAVLGVVYQLWLGGPAREIIIGSGGILSGAMLGTLAWFWCGRRPLLKPAALILLGFVSAVVTILWFLLLPAQISEPALANGAVLILIAYPIAALILGTGFAQNLNRAEVEAALKESEERYARLADAAFEGIGFCEQNIIFDANARLAEMLGYAQQELIGMPTEQFVAPESRDMVRRRVESGYQVMYEHLALRKDGSVFPVEVRSRPMQYQGRSIRVTVVCDISERLAAHHALAQSELRFRSAFHANPTPQILTHAADGTFLDVNAAYERLTGWSRDELLGKHTTDFPLWVDLDRAALMADMTATGRLRDRPTQVRDKAGALHDLILSIEPVQQDELPCLLCVMVDITARKQAEEALARSERLFKELVQSINAVVWEADAQTFVFSFVSEQAAKLLGYPASDWLATPTFWADHIHPDDRDRAVSYCVTCTHALENHEFEYRMIAADGRAVWLRDLVTVEVVDGVPRTLRGVMVDITARKRAEEELQLIQTTILAISTTEDLPTALSVALRQVCESTGWLLGQAWTLHADGTVLACSAAWWSGVPGLEPFRDSSENMTFQIGEGLPGRVWRSKEVIWIQDVTLEPNFPRSVAARAVGLIAGMAFPVLAGADVVAVLEFFVRQPQAEDAQLINLVSTVAAQLGAVIQRKQAEDALRASEERYRRIVETAEEGIWALDRANTTTFVNAKLASWLGYTVDEMVGQSAFAFLEADEQARVAARLESRRLGMREQYELRFCRKDGTPLWALVSASPIEDQQGAYAGAFAMLTDITAHKQAEAALRDSEARFRAMFESAAIGITLVDMGGHPIQSNPALLSMLGYTADEFPAMTFVDVTHPDDVDADRQLFQELISGARESYQLEKRYLRKDRQVVWGHLTVSLIRGGAEETLFAIGMVEDITERKRIEQQYLQAQKMDAIGRLAGGVAHDFNNLLTVILGSSELLLGELGRDHPLRRDVVPIQDAATRAVALTRQLLAFSRQQVLQPDIVNLNMIVASVEKLLRRLIAEDIILITHLAEHLGTIRADPSQLEQVLLNLAVNARDAMPNGGTLIIETANVLLDASYVDERGEVSGGPYVLMAISDTGCGMDGATQARIFEPFFTTKAPGKGTGLGLATVYGIVRQSGGHIWVYSEVGHGTTFKIYLPQATAPAVTIQPLPDRALAPQDTGTILLVEDEPLVRALASRILRARGYEVLEADNGVIALRIAADHRGRIDVLLTDVIMPGGLSGPQVAEHLLGHQPGLRVLYMSGYTDTALAHHATFDPRQNLLQKPFTSRGLVQAVWKVRHAREPEIAGVDMHAADAPH